MADLRNYFKTFQLISKSCSHNTAAAGERSGWLRGIPPTAVAGSDAGVGGAARGPPRSPLRPCPPAVAASPLAPIRCSPAPCEKVMLSCASVDHRLTGTDSSMKLSRWSESVAVGRVRGGALGGRRLTPLSSREKKSPRGFKGRNTAEGDVNLALIVSPFAPGRNDFHARRRANPS